jgi:hypothetical protein
MQLRSSDEVILTVKRFLIIGRVGIMTMTCELDCEKESSVVVGGDQPTACTHAPRQ